MIPCALFTSCSGLKPTELIKSILKLNELPSSSCILENVFSYPWNVDTKYYTADINLCLTDDRTIGSKEFAKSVQATVITFDTMKMSSFDEVKMWLPYLKEIQSPVQILVCDRSTEYDVITRRVLIGWCLDNGFELVELNPVESDDGSDEDDFKESFGIQRIVEALSCHSWPNMIMKDKPSFRSSYFEKLMNETAIANKSIEDSKVVSIVENEVLDEKEMKEVKKNLNASSSNSAFVSSGSEEVENRSIDSSLPNSTTKLSSQQIIDTLLRSDDTSAATDDESFEKLFERLQMMKETASSMPTDQRKEYAKDVTIQFWKSIGGNLEEIEGLSEEDDDDDD